MMFPKHEGDFSEYTFYYVTKSVEIEPRYLLIPESVGLSFGSMVYVVQLRSVNLPDPNYDHIALVHKDGNPVYLWKDGEYHALGGSLGYRLRLIEESTNNFQPYVWDKLLEIININAENKGRVDTPVRILYRKQAQHGSSRRNSPPPKTS